MTEILELAEKDFKATMIEMLQQAITNTTETNEKIISLSKEIDKLRK